MYPHGTYVPIGVNDRSRKQQAALDEMLTEVLDTAKDEYADAFAVYQAEGGELDLDTFILAEISSGR
jgi:hypothetical protein